MFAWLKKMFGGSEPAPPTRDVTLMTLAVGDVVVHLDETYVVEQRITYHQQGFFWFDYRLDAGDDKQAWLSVADDDELEVAFFHPIDLELDGEPPRTLTVDGVEYTLDESGEVDAKIDRGTGSETRTVVHCWDYEASGGRLLGIQRWGEDETEAAAGRAIRPVELDLLPGGG